MSNSSLVYLQSDESISESPGEPTLLVKRHAGFPCLFYLDGMRHLLAILLYCCRFCVEGVTGPFHVTSRQQQQQQKQQKKRKEEVGNLVESTLCRVY